MKIVVIYANIFQMPVFVHLYILPAKMGKIYQYFI